MPKLEIKSGKAAGHVVELTSSTVTLGNRRNATVELKDPWVSFNHAKITREGERYFIVDLRSKSGTFLNGKRIESSPTPLSGGDKVLLGKTEIHFLAEAPAAVASAPATATGGALAAAPPPPPVELLEKISTLERDLASAQKDTKNLREAHIAREKVLAETTQKLRAAETLARDAEKGLQAARAETQTARTEAQTARADADGARAEADRLRAAPPPPPPLPVMPAVTPGSRDSQVAQELARWQVAYNELKARYEDVVQKAKARIDDLHHRLEVANAQVATAKQQQSQAAAAAPSSLADQERQALVRKYEAEMKGFESALDDRNKDVERLEAALEKAASQLVNASAAASAPSGAGAGEAARVREELAEKAKRVDELTRINADLRTQLEEINTDMLEQEEELRGEISELERKLQEATPG